MIRANERLAGFAILDERSRLSGEREIADVAEFFVLRRYRRLGVGGQAAMQAFARFPRRWEVREGVSNAVAFWRRTIATSTSGKFAEVMVDDARWRGPVQTFEAVSP